MAHSLSKGHGLEVAAMSALRVGNLIVQQTLRRECEASMPSPRSVEMVADHGSPKESAEEGCTGSCVKFIRMSYSSLFPGTDVHLFNIMADMLLSPHWAVCAIP